MKTFLSGLILILTLSSFHLSGWNIHGDWQLKRVDGMTGQFSKYQGWDSARFAQLSPLVKDSIVHEFNTMSSVLDSMTKYTNRVWIDLWLEYFERSNFDLFTSTPDTSRLKWSFTKQNDSEIRIYADSGRVSTRLRSYWTQKDSIIEFSGFFGIYKQPVRFKIVERNDESLTLLYITGYEHSFPLRLYFRRVSPGQGNDLTLSGKDINTFSSHVVSNQIKVQAYNHHPFLIDHDRRLVIISEDGHVIDSQLLFPETGEGCSSALFQNGNDFRFVDCDGDVYQIDSKKGTIEGVDWDWKVAQPDKGYIGSYYYNSSLYYIQYPDSAFTFDNFFHSYDPRKN